MDPNAAFREMCLTTDPAEAAEHAANLLGWLTKGGYVPTAAHKEGYNMLSLMHLLRFVSCLQTD